MVIANEYGETGRNLRESWPLRTLIASIALIVSAGCSEPTSPTDPMAIADRDSLLQMELKSIENESFPLSEITNQPATVFVFLDGNCPICQRYASILNQIHQDYQDQGILILGVFPEQESEKFSGDFYKSEYNIDFPLFADPIQQLTKSLSATITPEVVVVDKRGEIRYRGAISNWFLGPGEKRSVVTEHYLRDALDHIIGGTEIDVRSTKPIGCYIS